MEVAVSGVRRRYTQLLAKAPDTAPVVDFENRWYDWSMVRAVHTSVNKVLDARGLGADARIGFVLENRPEHVATLIGLLASGRCVVTLSPLQPPERLSGDIETCALPAVVLGPGFSHREDVLTAITKSGVAIELGVDGNVRDLGGEVSDVAIATNPGVMVEMFTSGTTGTPKRVHLAESQVDRAISSAVAPPDDGRLLRKSVSLVVAPLVHIGGLWSVLAPIYAGRSIAMLPKFSVDRWVELITRHQPRAAGLVPAALRAVLEADVPREKIESLQVVTCGTAPCPPELAGKFYDKYGIRVLMTYGATEFAGAIARWTKPMHEEWWDTKKGSVGRASRGVDLRVVDPAGEPLPCGVEGILEIRTAQSPHGADVWVRTSDRAVIDGDGFLFIRGRTDDVIIRGGFKVHPEVIQGVLERHPAVREAAVVALPDPRLGHVPAAAVEVLPEVERPTPDGLRSLCRESLTPYEVPVFVAVLDELPRTHSSKVSRMDLKERIIAEMEAGERDSMAIRTTSKEVMS